MTVVDGKIIFKNGRILGVNEGRIIREAEEVVRAALMEAEEYLPKASWLRS
jgi:N-acyl-D-aspartate/D-glutamate deacylase